MNKSTDDVADGCHERHWHTVSLGSVCNVVIGKTPNRRRDDYWMHGTLPWATIRDMRGSLIEDTRECITLRAVEETGMRLVPRGTILLSFKLTIGKVAMAAIDIYTNEAIAAVIPNSETILSIPYLYFLLQSIDLGQYARQAVKGNTVTKAILLAAPIPLPPLPVQERIVAILEKADEIRRKRREALQIADQILPALFIEMFGDPATNPKSWPSLPLGQLAETKMGSTPKTDMPDYWQPATVPWVTPADMEKGTVNRVHFGERAISPAGLRNSSATLLPTSAVLLTTTATIGKIGIAKCPLATNQQVTGIICGPELDSSYLAYYLLLSGEESIADLGGASTATHVNQANLRRFKVPLPPLPQQQRFADYALAYEIVHAKLQASLRDA